MLFLEVVLPVLCILGAGFLFGRFTATDLRPLSQFTLVVLSPALIFGYLATADVAAGVIARAAAYIVLYVVAAGLLTVVVARLTGLSALVSPLLLVSVFTNSGNYGLPIILFAYGREGFLTGVSVLAIHLLIMYPVGTWFATLGAGDWRRGLRTSLTTPPVIAGLLAFAVRVVGLPIPEGLLRAIRLVGDAGVPVILLLLGMQVARTKVEGSLKPIAVGSALRLVLGPILAVALTYPLGLTGLTAKVLVLQHAMPTAAIMVLLALEYDARPDVVASVTVVTTAISAVTVTAVLYFLAWAY